MNQPDQWFDQISGFSGSFEEILTPPSAAIFTGGAAHRWAVNGRGGLDFNVDSAARRDEFHRCIGENAVIPVDGN